MLNNTIIVGRIVREPELKETETGKKVTNLTLAVPRTYKNISGEYETDFIPCVLWQGIAESTTKYCKKGDMVAVKGHVQSREYETEETKHHIMELVAEKITFLSSKREDKENQ